jgi:hypothetical protein
MNDTRVPHARHGAGNGRTPEENREYAKLAANSQPRAMQLANAAAGRAARSAKLAAAIDPDGTMDPAELEREIKRRKDAQLARARAARLTRLRRARAAAGRLVDELVEADAALTVAEAEAAEA